MTTARWLLGAAIGALSGLAGGYLLWHGARAPAVAAPPGQSAATPAPEPGTVELEADTVQALGITTMVLPIGTATPTFAAPGRLVADPAAVTSVRAPLPGQLAVGPDALPRLGDAVSAGAVIARLQPRLSPSERTDLLQRRLQAAAEVEAARIAAAAAQQELQRVQALHADGNAASLRAVEQAELEQETQIARGEAAQQLLQSLPDAGPGAIELQAPRAGIVTDVLAHIGENIEAGGVVLQLTDVSQLLARIEVPAGADIDVTFDRAHLELLDAARTIVEANRRAWVAGADSDRAVLLGVSTTAGELRPGLPVIAHLPRRGGLLSGVVLPESAILRRGDGACVFVRRASNAGTTTFARLPVTLDAPAPGGWLSLPRVGGPQAGADLVVGGVDALWSVERQRRADAEAGG